jgi:hypothetical protein
MTAYTVPTNPADPCAAALEMIVCLPAVVQPRAAVLREVLQEIAALLDAEDAFTGMSWHDAKHAATAIIIDALEYDDVVERLQARAQRVTNGHDGIFWDDPAAMARALTIAATVLAL